MTAAEMGLMAGSPPAKDKQVTVDNWQGTPWNRWSFQHMREVIPSARIWRGDGPVAELERDPASVGDVEFETMAGETEKVAAFLDRSYTDGFIVLRHGRVVTEQYFNGMMPHTRHLLMSVSKSMTGALAGVLVERGVIEPARAVSHYVPESGSTSFEGATVRQILDMSTGTRFSEDYTDPEAEVCVYESAAGWRPVPSGGDDELDLFLYILQLQNSRPHGERFDYRSILTDLLGWIIERATGRRFADLMSELIWAPLGAESDAEICVDRHGNPMTDGGISLTLRDMARFGQMYQRRGSWNGQQIVPAHWVDDTRYGDETCRRAFANSDLAGLYPEGHYRNQWWVPNSEAGIVLAAGIFGQFIYVDMPADVIVVKQSTLPFALDPANSADHRRAFASIVKAVA